MPMPTPCPSSYLVSGLPICSVRVSRAFWSPSHLLLSLAFSASKSSLLTAALQTLVHLDSMFQVRGLRWALGCDVEAVASHGVLKWVTPA